MTDGKQNKQVTLYSLLAPCMNYLSVTFITGQYELKHMILYDKIMPYNVNNSHFTLTLL